MMKFLSFEDLVQMNKRWSFYAAEISSTVLTRTAKMPNVGHFYIFGKF